MYLTWFGWVFNGFLLVDLLAGLFVHWFVVTAANTRFQIDILLDVYPIIILLTILWFFDCATAATFNVWLISMLMNSMDCLINMHLNIYSWLGAYLSLRNLLPSLTVTSFLGSAVYSRIFSAVVSSEQLVWWPTLIKALLLFSDLFRMKFNPLQIQTYGVILDRSNSAFLNLPCIWIWLGYFHSN